MNISKTMLRAHLECVTLGYLSLGGEPTVELSDLDGAIREMRLAAQADGDLPWIKLALDHLLTTPGATLREYGGGQHPHSEDSLQDMFRRIWDQLWPNDALSAPGEAASVELVEMPGDEWRALKAALPVRA